MLGQAYCKKSLDINFQEVSYKVNPSFVVCCYLKQEPVNAPLIACTWEPEVLKRVPWY